MTATVELDGTLQCDQGGNVALRFRRGLLLQGNVQVGDVRLHRQCGYGQPLQWVTSGASQTRQHALHPLPTLAHTQLSPGVHAMSRPRPRGTAVGVAVANHRLTLQTAAGPIPALAATGALP